MEKIDKIIETTVNAFLNEEIYREPLLEMARINKKETTIFPYNAWELKIWSNDHNPPHFHIISDGWDVSFLIENGKVLEVKMKGNKSNVYDYMLNNVKFWLTAKCVAQPKLTNQENAMLQWEQLHDN